MHVVPGQPMVGAEIMVLIADIANCAVVVPIHRSPSKPGAKHVVSS